MPRRIGSARLLAGALVLAGCDAPLAELVVDDGARTLVLAAGPSAITIQPLGGGARDGAIDDGAVLIAVLYAQELRVLNVSAGPLTAAHEPFPAPLAQHVLDDAGAWRPLAALPEWLAAVVQPPCPPLETSLVTEIGTSTRGVELYTALDAARALARVGDRLVTVDAEGRVAPASRTILPFVGNAHTDGARVWLLGGRWGADTGRLLEGRVDPDASLVIVAPPGWPAEAGGVRRVSGGRDQGGPPEVVVATDNGWLLAYDGVEWSVRFRPSRPVLAREARAAWLERGRVAHNPAYVGPELPRLLEVRGSTSADIEIEEPSVRPERERVFSLARDDRGGILAGGTLGRAYRVAPGGRTSTLLGEVGGEIHSIGESEGRVWTYGPLGLSRIDPQTRVVCPPIEAAAFTGTGTLVTVEGAVLLGGEDVIQRARRPR